MKAISNYWFGSNSLFGAIGIVVGEDEFTHQRKGYIGFAAGHDQERDIKHILETGSPVPPGMLQEIINDLKPTVKPKETTKESGADG